MKPRYILRTPSDAAELQHAVIEQAKASHKADGCDMTWEQCLAFHAENMVRPPFAWHLGEQNGVWAFTVEETPTNGG